MMTPKNAISNDSAQPTLRKAGAAVRIVNWNLQGLLEEKSILTEAFADLLDDKEIRKNIFDEIANAPFKAQFGGAKEWLVNEGIPYNEKVEFVSGTFRRWLRCL